LKKTAYLFPGQGAQYSGMAADLLASVAVKSLFDTASGVLGKDIKELLESDAQTLKRTDVSQPAITAANLAAAAFLGERGYSPSVCAGFSLGEYAALVCSGVLNISDCFHLVKARGEIMQKTADNLREASLQNSGDASSAPGMAAVIGLDPKLAEDLIVQWKSSKDACEDIKDLYAANINSPRQLVISGTACALEEAQSRFIKAGARRVILLQVAGPFHSPLMEEARIAFVPVLETVSFNDPVIPVFSNVTGMRIKSGAEAKELAALHITHPVRWVDEEEAVAKSGIEACFEAGPGKVLQGLWNDYRNDIPIYAAGTVGDIERIIKE